MDIEPSSQRSFQKQNFCNSDQKLRRSSYQSFLLFSKFAWFIYFFLNNLSKIAASYLIFSGIIPKHIVLFMVSENVKILLLRMDYINHIFQYLCKIEKESNLVMLAMSILFVLPFS